MLDCCCKKTSFYLLFGFVAIYASVYIWVIGYGVYAKFCRVKNLKPHFLVAIFHDSESEEKRILHIVNLFTIKKLAKIKKPTK